MFGNNEEAVEEVKEEVAQEVVEKKPRGKMIDAVVLKKDYDTYYPDGLKLKRYKKGDKVQGMVADRFLELNVAEKKKIKA